MSGKFEHKKTNRKKGVGLKMILIVFAILLLAAAALLLFSGRDGSAPDQKQTAPKTEITETETAQAELPTSGQSGLGEDLQILSIGSYTGAYVEDGTDEVLSGILMMKIINNGEKPVQYAKITMTIGGKTAEFTVSTLNPGATVILLEKNRMNYDGGADYSKAVVTLENLALFEEPLNLHEDKIQIQILDGAINVTNISGQDIPGKISIYYKNNADGIYYGGITYRVTLDGGLKTGEIRQMMADHFSDTGSEIMFVSIAQ